MKRVFFILFLISNMSFAAKPLPKEIQEALFEHMQDEFYAEAFYTKVLSKYKEDASFLQFAELNKARLQKLYQLFTKYNLEIPLSIWNPENVEIHYAKEQICFLGFKNGKEKVDALNRYLKLELPFDIKDYFDATLKESMEIELPGFALCAQ